MGELFLTPRRPARWWCKRVSAAVCLVFLAYASFTAIHFAVNFNHGMAYMREEQAHPVQSDLTLNGHRLSWYKVNDEVMGGHSTSRLEATESGGLRFSGHISTRDGGFASASTVEQPLDLPAQTTGLNVSVTGNGELYKLTLKVAKSVWEPIWEADFPKSTTRHAFENGAVRTSFVLPLTDFSASRMGRVVKGRTLNVSAVQAVGLNLALIDTDGEPNPAFDDGPFEVVLHSIEAV